ncbi:hypothetical protein MRB53_017387 [Persea americana]|uniref:Uncharacterized protein n=1 Tax=Persea americana TaxID=3435 RepID=A0ACC2M5F7_PERAE|nr:hypothetical protein MRB53_017387 [Persea americana]
MQMEKDDVVSGFPNIPPYAANHNFAVSVLVPEPVANRGHWWGKSRTGGQCSQIRGGKEHMDDVVSQPVDGDCSGDRLDENFPACQGKGDTPPSSNLVLNTTDCIEPSSPVVTSEIKKGAQSEVPRARMGEE